jgi:hypothetical protein
MGNPILTPRAGEKVAERLPKDIRRGTCAENYDATTEEQRKKLFNEHGNGWELVDRYLDLNDGDNGNTNNWAQEIYLDLFPGEGSGQFECSGETDKCVTTKECSKQFHTVLSPHGTTF